MIIQHREPADGDGEDFCKFLEPAFDPLLTVPGRFAQEQCAAHATSDAVIPACNGDVDQVSASHCHRCFSSA